jgi:hypothetical protein
MLIKLITLNFIKKLLTSLLIILNKKMLFYLFFLFHLLI